MWIGPVHCLGQQNQWKIFFTEQDLDLLQVHSCWLHRKLWCASLSDFCLFSYTLISKAFFFFVCGILRSSKKIFLNRQAVHSYLLSFVLQNSDDNNNNRNNKEIHGFSYMPATKRKSKNHFLLLKEERKLMKRINMLY